MNWTYFFQLIILAIPLSGAILWLCDRPRFNPAFAPILAVASATLIVFLGGLIGYLPWAAYLVGLLGLAAWADLIGRMARRKFSLRSVIASPALWFFAALCLFFAWRTYGMLVQHVDNFSHWLTLCKEMSVTDAYPVEGTAIFYRNYPPGSATFIYLVTKVLGYSEGACLLGQGILLSASLSAAFCGVRFKHFVSALSLAIGSMAMLCVLELSHASLHIYNLLVDGLMGYVTVAAGMIAYFYRKDLRRCLSAMICVTAFLCLIKSSARIFAAMLAVLVLLLFFRRIFHRGALRQRSTYTALGGILGMVGIQLLLPSLWNWRTAIVSPTHVDRFASGVGGVLEDYQKKDASYLKGVFDRMIEAATDPESVSAQILLVAVMVALVALAAALIMRQKPRLIGMALLAALGTVVVYFGELFFLYGFIFSGAEAEELASFARYYSTGAVVIGYPLLVAAIYQFKKLAEKTGKRWLALPLCCLSLVGSIACCVTLRPQMVQLADPWYRPETAQYKELRAEYHALFQKAEGNIPRNSNLVVYLRNTSYFVSRMPHSEFLSKNAFITTWQTAEETAQKVIDQADYAVNDLAPQDFRQKLYNLGYTVQGDGSAIVYTVDQANKTLTPVS